VIVGEVQQDGEPGAALDQGADRTATCCPDDQVALPVTRDRPIGDLSGAVADGELLTGVHAAPLHPASGFACRPPSGQAFVQVSAHTAAALHIQALVDGLVTHL
jgi:hypothetical protein